MKHADFRIGTKFLTGSGTWRCTDVGTRTIAAIQLSDADGHPAHDDSWFVGPPYAVEECVFDEYDFEGCELVEH